MLSPRVQSVLDFVIAFKTENGGDSPSIRQIQTACRIPSSSTVQYYLDRLDYLGYIERRAGTSRGIRVKGGKWTYEQP